MRNSHFLRMQVLGFANARRTDRRSLGAGAIARPLAGTGLGEVLRYDLDGFFSKDSR